jgi:hypothetical protein
MKTFSIALLIAVAASISTAEAGQHLCNHCGCRQNCRKVCRLICGTKKEVKTEYSCECEDFCIPGPSQKCGVKCECNRLGIKCCHAVYKPTCAKVHTKRVLVKKEVSKEVPDYKWVVEEVCCHCGQCIDGTQQPTAGPKAAMALYGAKVEADAALFESPGGIQQVSAEEEAIDSYAVGEEEALASDEDEEPQVSETPVAYERKPRGLLQTLFGK